LRLEGHISTAQEERKKNSRRVGEIDVRQRKQPASWKKRTKEGEESDVRKRTGRRVVKPRERESSGKEGRMGVHC